MICKNQFNEPTITHGQMNLLFSIRNFWRDIATWTRAYMVNRSAGLEVADEVFNRLYRIPLEFGNLMQYFIGYDNAVYFIQLLSQQLILFRSLLDAQMAGDSNTANQIVQQLYQLAEVRAEFLNSINPFWDKTQMSNNLDTYIQFTIEEMNAILTKEYSKDINIYDRLIHHADNMGDYFTNGLLNYMTYSRQQGNTTGG